MARIPTGRLRMPVLIAAAVLLAACGGSNNNSQTAATSSTATPQAPAAATSAATRAATGTAAASPSAAATAASRSFTDDAGKTLIIAQPPKRVVALSPSIVEILYAVNAPPIARPTSATYPDAANALPTIGSSYQVNAEQVAAQQPDLIMADAQIQRPDVVAELQKIAPVYSMRVQTYDDVLKDLRTAGNIMGKPADGEKAAKAIEDKLAAVQAKLPAQKPTVFIMIGVPEAFFAAKPTSFVGDLVAKLGGKNLVTEGPDDAGFPGFTTYSMEKLTQLDPDVILVATAGPPGGPKTSEALKANPGWAALRAVKSGHVYEIDPVTLVQSAGPRVSQDIDELAADLYPGVFPTPSGR